MAFVGDLTKQLPVEDCSYGAIISSGIFTSGHVSPDALDEVLRIAKEGALIGLSINGVHWGAASFECKFNDIAPRIAEFSLQPVRYYGDAASGKHKDDEGKIALFKKR